ncbi:hypothetical protein ACFQ5F_16560 [Kroppenstedtia eburnea]|uniref:hypothetical protein n=1 Tax=Kroppenstedtia eburnea TaxID=714067 RepID=UPI00362D3214
MLVNVSAMLSVIILTGYTLVLIHRHREYLTCMMAMMLAMGVAMMGGLLIGTVFGVLFNQMFAPTVYAVSAGMVLGYSAGRPIHLIASLDGMLAGIMGGMMGAMLGVMVHPEAPVFMVGFMNLLFLITMILIIRLIHEEVIERRKRIQKVPQPTPWLLRKPWLVGLPIGLLVVIAADQSLLSQEIPLFRLLQFPGINPLFSP